MLKFFEKFRNCTKRKNVIQQNVEAVYTNTHGIIKKLNILSVMIVVIFLFGMSIGNVVINKYTNNRDIKEDNLIMAYDEVKNGENATQSEYVTFDAYFAQGSRKSRGIASELNNRPELCLDLNVLTDGRLENGKIILESGNYKIMRDIVPDNEVLSYSNNVINLKTIQKGTQKSIYILMDQTVMDNELKYGYKDRLSKVNKVTFTGTHVSEDGKRTGITKTVDFTLDWYGKKNLEEIRAKKTAVIANRASNKVILEISAEMWAYGSNSSELEVQVPEKAAVLTATIPTMNGVPADEVIVRDSSKTEKELTYDYNKSTRNLTIRDEMKYDEQGKAERSKQSERYIMTITIVYPYSAYNFASTKSLNVTFNGYLEGYNNPNVGASIVRSPVGSKTVNVNLRNPQGDLILFNTKIEHLAKSRVRLYYDREIDTYNPYKVTWTANVNYARGMDGLIFEEDATNSVIGGEKQYHTDHTQALNGTYYSLDGIASYAGIMVPASTFKVLGNGGIINITDMSTGNIIKTITAEDADTYFDYYELGAQVDHIRIDTSAPLSSGKVEIYNYKQINNVAFKEIYTKNQFNEMTLFYTSLNGKIIRSGEYVFINRDIDTKDYEDGSSMLRVSTRMQLNTQKLNDVDVSLRLIARNEPIVDKEDAEWVDPIFILEYPSEIDSVNIKEIFTNDGDLQLEEIDEFQSNGKKCIKIKMSGVTRDGSEIHVKQSIRMNPSTTKTTGELRIFSYNELCDEWHYYNTNNRYAEDIYDIDLNGITSEERCINYTELVYSKPTGLYTNTEALNFDSKGTIIMGPDVANVEKTKAGTKATVRLNIYNNYNTAVTNAKIVGKIPFKNNTYQINSGKLGSNFTATMSNQGIILPSNLQGRVDVYYSTNEKVNSDLLDQSNNWVQNPTDWTEVKNYLIDFSKISMNPGESYTIDYVIEFPDELIMV